MHIIPQLWFPNTWSWPIVKPPLPLLYGALRNDTKCITAKHPTLGKTHLYCLPSPPPVSATSGGEVSAEEGAVDPQLLFTENNTNHARLYGGVNETPFVKDAFHDHIIPSHRPSPKSENVEVNEGSSDASPPQATFINPENKGTKSAAHYIFKDVPGRGGCAVVRLKLTPLTPAKDPSIEDECLFDDAVEGRRQEADEFYNSLVFGPISDDLKQIMRQALGGMLWTKQHYRFIQKEWIEGDPGQPPPPPERKLIRNRVRDLSVCNYKHLNLPSLSTGMETYAYRGYIIDARQVCVFPSHPKTLIKFKYTQVGIPLLRRVGYSVPLHTASGSRPCLCKKTA